MHISLNIKLNLIWVTALIRLKSLVISPTPNLLNHSLFCVFSSWSVRRWAAILKIMGIFGIFGFIASHRFGIQTPQIFIELSNFLLPALSPLFLSWWTHSGGRVSKKGRTADFRIVPGFGAFQTLIYPDSSTWSKAQLIFPWPCKVFLSLYQTYP